MHAISCEICGEIRITIYMFQRCSRRVFERRTDGEFNQFSDWMFYITLCIKRLISPSAPSLEAHVIPAPSLHRASTHALISVKLVVCMIYITLKTSWRGFPNYSFSHGLCDTSLNEKTALDLFAKCGILLL